jgi:beta-glucosidase
VDEPKRSDFPDDFRFGAATAAFQIEGATREDGRGESIWDRFCATPGTVAHGATGEVACDHYHRWQEDLALMSELGLQSYRFSVAWPRVQPTGRGTPNRAGLDFYKRLVAGLRERGIEPVATLYHWDLPQALQDEGGWANRETTERFAEYAGIVAEELGDGIESWITHNEPWVVAFLGHAEGRKAPGVRDWPTALAVAHHLLLSHGLAVDVLRERLPAGTPVGITLNLTPARPASDAQADRDAARRMDGYMNRWFLDPVLRGRYPEDMLALYEQRFGALPALRADDLPRIARPIDFLGVNYYFPQTVRAAASGVLEAEPIEPEPPLTTMGWPVDPSGLHELLVRLRADYGEIPIEITENGSAWPDPSPTDGVIEDPPRLDYLEGHLAAVARAIADGVDVRRYFAWSLMDNFEWEHGYEPRFGIVGVDYETQRRIPKRSGLWYRDLIAAGRSPASAAHGV